MNDAVNKRNPTRAELEILRVLWVSPNITVREVCERLPRATQSYTTVLKLLQIMLEKSLVVRDEDDRAHRYSAACTEPDIKNSLVSDLLNRAFEGAAKNLVLYALSAGRPTARELAEIRRMLEKYEEENR